MLRTLARTSFAFLTTAKRLTSSSNINTKIPKIIIGTCIGMYIVKTSIQTNAIEDK